MECKLIDPTQILTNIRTHTCGKGHKFIGKDAFLKVSERDNNLLNRAYVTKLVDKQSAPIALKVFSQEVESMMFENSDTEQAEFVSLIQNWYHAIDKHGLSVVTRASHLQNIADFLNSLVQFEVYPPPRQYIAGIPIVTFKSIMEGILTLWHMYRLATTTEVFQHWALAYPNRRVGGNEMTSIMTS